MFIQIALQNGCPLDWGIVEYNNWKDAEATQTSLDGYCLLGQRIRIIYYVPGNHAINIYHRLLSNVGTNSYCCNIVLRVSWPVSAVFEIYTGLFSHGPRFTLKPNISAASLDAIFSGYSSQPNARCEPHTHLHYSCLLYTSRCV